MKFKIVSETILRYHNGKKTDHKGCDEDKKEKGTSCNSTHMIGERNKKAVSDLMKSCVKIDGNERCWWTHVGNGVKNKKRRARKRH